LPKITQAKAMAAGRDIDIEVDGGVDASNIESLVRAGANVFVAGSSIFKGDIAAIAYVGAKPAPLFRDIQGARYHRPQQREQLRFSGRLALGLDVDE